MRDSGDGTAMRNWENFHKITNNKSPRKNVVHFISKYKISGNAIDLGCGSGSDTIFLIQNNLNVLAFVGNFFGINDEWNTKEDKRTLFSKEDVIKLFNNFEILEIQEIEKNKPTAEGK